MNFPSQKYKISITDFAKKYGISRQSAQKLAKDWGVSKNREQYEQDAQERRRIAYELRESGLKWREIGEKLGISTANAQMLAHRYKTALRANESVLDDTENKTA